MSSEDNKKRGYLQGISSYIPEYVKQNFSLSDLSFGSSTAKGAASALFSDKDKEDVNYTCFQSVEYRTSTTVHKRLYLMLAYKTGFQVFDVTDANRVHEVTSVKDKNCKTIQMLPYPAKQEPGVLHNKHPIVAVVTAGDKTETNCMLKFYSLKTQEYVNILQFNSEVFQVACNNSVIAVVVKNQIFLFNIHTLEKMSHLNCFPNNEESNNSSNSLIALGERWIAYPSNQPVNNSKLDFAHFSNQSYTEITMDVAKKAASGIMYLGDLGVKKVVNYMNPEKEPQAPVQQKTSYSGVPHAGTIEIRDLETKQTVAHFRAHNQPISCLAFDPSGTVLASASQEGTFVHVFQIMPPSSGKVSTTGRGLRHLYKLYRGITSALIQNMTFSINSKWIAVSSEHGTTHIFAIEPNGGEVGPDTHCLNTGGLSPRPTVASSKEPFTYSSVSKIKHSSMMPISISESKPAGSISSYFFSPSRSSTSTKQTSVAEKMFVATGKGLLLYYRLDPFESNFEQRTLDLRVKMLGTWDLCRFKHQDAFASPLSIDQYLTISSTSQKRSVEDLTSQWIANVEIETYDPPNIQLWMTGQFKFKTFEKSKLHNSLDQLLRVEDSPVVQEEEEFNNQMTKSVFIRVTDPIPITRIGSSISDDDPSAPPMSESEISRAIETPMGAASSDKPKDWEFLEHSEVVAQVQSIELKSKNNTRPLSSFITNHNHLGGSKPSGNVPQKKVSIAETPVTIPPSTPAVTPKTIASPQQVLPTPQNGHAAKSEVKHPQVQRVEPKPLTSPVVSPVIQATLPHVQPLKPVEKSKLYPSLESPAEKKKGDNAYTEYFRETAPSVQPSTPVQQIKEYQPPKISTSATPVTPASTSSPALSAKKEEAATEHMKTSGSKAFFFAMNDDYFNKQKQNQVNGDTQQTIDPTPAPVTEKPAEVKQAKKEEQNLLHFSNFDVAVQQHEPILSVDTFTPPSTKKYPSPPKSGIKINNDFFGQAKSTTFDILSEPYATTSTLQRSTLSTTSSAMYNTALRTDEEDEEIQMKLKVLQESEKEEDQDNIEEVLSEEEDIVL